MGETRRSENMTVSQEKLREIVEALIDMVNQHCQVGYGKKNDTYLINDMALSANENAIYVLETLGLITKGGKGNCILEWNVDKAIKELSKA
jgi:hypothetical protein